MHLLGGRNVRVFRDERWRRSMLAGLFFAAVPAASEAQPPQPTLSSQAQRSVVAAAPADAEGTDLAGGLSEAAGRRAAPASDFIQIDPDNGKPATDPTEVRLLYSRD